MPRGKRGRGVERHKAMIKLGLQMEKCMISPEKLRVKGMMMVNRSRKKLRGKLGFLQVLEMGVIS